MGAWLPLPCLSDHARTPQPLPHRPGRHPARVAGASGIWAYSVLDWSKSSSSEWACAWRPAALPQLPGGGQHSPLAPQPSAPPLPLCAVLYYLLLPLLLAAGFFAYVGVACLRERCVRRRGQAQQQQQQGGAAADKAAGSSLELRATPVGGMLEP